MSNTWDKAKVGDLANVILGQSPPSDTYNQKREGLPFYQGKADFGRINPITRFWCTVPSKVARSNDILMSVRAPVGVLNIAVEECCIGRGVAAIRAENTDSKYLFYQLDFHKLELSLLAQGSTFEAISGSEIRSFKIPNAKRHEQKKIAEVLTSVDKVIELTDIEIEKLQNLKKGMMQDLLTKGIGHSTTIESAVGPVPKSWSIEVLSDLVLKGRKITYGIVQPGSYDERGVLLVRGQDYISGWAEAGEVFKVSVEIEKKFERARLNVGDVVICIAGAGVGTVNVVPMRFNGANITQTTARVSCDEKKILGKYLYYYLQEGTGLKQIQKYIKGSAQPGLNLNDVEKFLIKVPPLAEQSSIVKALDSVELKVENTKVLLAKYQSLKKALMQDLLTGRVRVKV